MQNYSLQNNYNEKIVHIFFT